MTRTLIRALVLALAMFPLGALAQSRAVLSGPLTLYVTPSGSDSNPCTQVEPCLSQLAALHLVQSSHDLACQRVTINVADGTYAIGTTGFSGSFVGACAGARSVQIIGDAKNQDAVVVAPTSGYCWDWQNGAAYFIEGMKCIQTKNNSNPAGPGQDEINVFNGSTAELNLISFGDDGPGGFWNDMTVVRATVIVDGCLNGKDTGEGCGINLEKPAGNLQQAHALCDGCYILWDNNNCVDQGETFCTPLAMHSAPKYQDFFIIIDGGVVNYTAFVYPQGSYAQGSQCSIRTNGVLFTAGNANGSQRNLDAPGTANTCATASGGQAE